MLFLSLFFQQASLSPYTKHWQLVHHCSSLLFIILIHYHSALLLFVSRLVSWQVIVAIYYLIWIITYSFTEWMRNDGDYFITYLCLQFIYFLTCLRACFSFFHVWLLNKNCLPACLPVCLFACLRACLFSYFHLWLVSKNLFSRSLL